MNQGVTTRGEEDVHVQKDVDSRRIERILENHDRGRGTLIAILEQIQAEYGCLPQEALRMVADRTGQSLVDVYGVATFYRSFSLQPRGKHLITVCLGTACHVRGAPRVAQEFEQQLGIKAGQTTPDKEFTLETVNCLGSCALGPVVVVDGRYFSKVKKSRVAHLINDALEGLDEIRVGEDERVFPIEVSCPRCNHNLMDKSFTIDGYPSIRITLSFGHKHGWLRLSSLYGSYNISAEHDIPIGTVVSFFCPHCHTKLAGSWRCPTCGAPMAPMIVHGGAVVHICSRRGCKGHMLNLSGANV